MNYTARQPLSGSRGSVSSFWKRAAAAKGDTAGAGARPRTGGRWLPSRGAAAVFALALVVRLGYQLEIRNLPTLHELVMDAQRYDALAREILDHGWMPRGSFYQAPLYPYLLAAVYAVSGRSLAAVRLAQALLGALTAVLAGIAGGRLWERTATGRRESPIAGPPPPPRSPACWRRSMRRRSSIRPCCSRRCRSCSSNRRRWSCCCRRSGAPSRRGGHWPPAALWAAPRCCRRVCCSWRRPRHSSCSPPGRARRETTGREETRGETATFPPRLYSALSSLR